MVGVNVSWMKRFERLFKSLGTRDVRVIGRRYFVTNSFDGVLTSLGIVIGSFLVGVDRGVDIVRIGAGAAIGLSLSGVWGVYEVERAERRREILEIEEAMLVDLGDTDIADKKRMGVLWNTFLSGLGPLVGCFTPLLPFTLANRFLSIRSATILSILVAMLLLFVMGAYMGKISRRSLVISGFRMLLAGVAAVTVLLLLHHYTSP